MESLPPPSQKPQNVVSVRLDTAGVSQDTAAFDDDNSIDSFATAMDEFPEDDSISTTPCCEGRLASGIVTSSQALLSTPLLVLWMLLVTNFGAAFFFLIIEATQLEHPKDQEYLNISIQGLNVMFTYAAIANQPVRLRAMIRLLRLIGTVGVAHDATVSTQIWDYIPWWHRFSICSILNLNCIFQFINQGFRIQYYSWQLVTHSHLAELWTNLFFVLSFVPLCAPRGHRPTNGGPNKPSAEQGKHLLDKSGTYCNSGSVANTTPGPTCIMPPAITFTSGCKTGREHTTIHGKMLCVVVANKR
jgi:hypothetical protein